jgi:hypothetical protein
MMVTVKHRWALLLAANVMVWCMLNFPSSHGASPSDGKQPFNNAVEQRERMIRELTEIKVLLKEQNALLLSGAGVKPARK